MVAAERSKQRARSKHERRRRTQGATALESVLCAGDPMLGPYLRTAHAGLMESLAQDSAFKRILPNLIDAPALLAAYPGLTQIELASLLGMERASVGRQVAQCVERGYARRSLASSDRRRYELHVTEEALRLLDDARRVIPLHERLFAQRLSRFEG